MLVDVDAMFCAVAAQTDPQGAGATDELIVGGGAGDRGVVCSCSYAVRRLGVHAGMPLTRARRLARNALVVPVPKEAVGVAARALRDVLADWTPVVVPASVDEAYLDMTGCEPLWGDDLAATAFGLRLDVLARTGLPISVGGAETPWLAKIAASLAKPHRGGTGIHIIQPGPIAAAEAVRDLALDDLPGIGSKLGQRLAALGLHTVAEARAVNPDHLQQWIGTPDGPNVLGWIWGQDPSPLRARTTTPQVGREATLAKDLTTRAQMIRHLRALGSRAAYDARQQGIAVRTVTVVMRTSDFTTLQRSLTPGPVVWDDDAVHTVVLDLFVKLRDVTQLPVRLLGVRLKGTWLVDPDPEDAVETERDDATTQDFPPSADVTAFDDDARFAAESGDLDASGRHRQARGRSREPLTPRPSPRRMPLIPATLPDTKGVRLAKAMDALRAKHGAEAVRWAGSDLPDS